MPKAAMHQFSMSFKTFKFKPKINKCKRTGHDGLSLCFEMLVTPPSGNKDIRYSMESFNGSLFRFANASNLRQLPPAIEVNVVTRTMNFAK